MNTQFFMSVTAKQQGMLLYEFLDIQFPFFKKECWANALVKNSVKIQGLPKAGNPPLNAGDNIEFSIQQYNEPPVNTQWQLYWENNDLCVAHKPANLPVQRTTRNIHNTLTALVRRDLNLPTAQPLHRLDLETAGFVLFSKNLASTKLWQPQLKTLLQKKVYRALVWGKPEWQNKTFTCRLATQPDSPIRCKMYCTAYDITQNNQAINPKKLTHNKPGKISTTYFKALQTWDIAHSNTANNTAASQVFSLIECELDTGRKHQIRAQLAYLGHPIVGDKIYGHDGAYYLKRLEDAITPEDDAMLLTSHHLLVACRAKLTLEPDSEQSVQLCLNEEDYPKQWIDFIEKLHSSS